MAHSGVVNLPLDRLPSPCYVVDRSRLAHNLEILSKVQVRSGAKIILALKGFALFAAFPQIREVLCGTTASSCDEARLGQEEFGGEVHVCAVAYTEDELRWLAARSRHITLNSLSQLERFRDVIEETRHQVSYGLRINPEYSEVSTEIYNPCRPGSRFGMTADALAGADLTGIEGLHFHTLCEQNADTLERTLAVVTDKFGPWLKNMKWLNMGGGHHITRADYDIDRLCACIKQIHAAYSVQVYLEPGEAIALNTGYLVSTVLDVFTSGGQPIAILDTSATAHMPDVLEMPYRPEILSAGAPGEKAHACRLGGLTCLAGDIIGDYAFDHPLQVGDQLVFTDMAHYTMVKNTTFNGIRLPAIALIDTEKDTIEVVRTFGYEDYRSRLS